LEKRRRRDFWEHSKEFCRRELSYASDLPLRLTDSGASVAEELRGETEKKQKT